MKRGQGEVITVIVLVVLFLGLFLLLFYLFYLYVPGDPQELFVIVGPEQTREPPVLPVSQFYPQMKFNHKAISFHIDKTCDEEVMRRSREAFSLLETEVGIISFFEINSGADVEVSCSSVTSGKKDVYFVAGEGGARHIIQSGDYNIITNGTILLRETPTQFVQCDWPNIELHELLHVFGFDHSDDKNSIMFPFLKSCTQSLDESIIIELRRLYSEENVADLLFANVSVVKKGRYLDYSFTIQNHGTIDASSVSLSILDSGEEISSEILGDIAYGAGISIQATNFRLKHRNPDEILFIIDRENTVIERDETNNVAKAL